jgi:uncharacterized protein (DUF1778 family)
MTTKLATKLKAITVRFTDEEKENTEQNADITGLSVSRFLALTGSAGHQPVTAEEKALLIKILAVLNRMAKNINDLAKASNASRYGAGGKPEDSEIETAASEVKKLVQAIRKRINL